LYRGLRGSLPWQGLASRIKLAYFFFVKGPSSWNTASFHVGNGTCSHENRCIVLHCVERGLSTPNPKTAAFPPEARRPPIAEPGGAAAPRRPAAEPRTGPIRRYGPCTKPVRTCPSRPAGDPAAATAGCFLCRWWALLLRRNTAGGRAMKTRIETTSFMEASPARRTRQGCFCDNRPKKQHFVFRI